MTTITDIEAASRPCPTCHTVPNPETGRCRCPRPPADRAPATASTPDTLVPHAETLFESYLAARLVRARRVLTTTKVALLRDPSSRPKLDALRAAEAETRKLHEQLIGQRRKMAAESAQTAAPSGDAEPTEGFRLRQAVKADAVYQSGGSRDRSVPDDRECPKCGDRVSGNATSCACGHQFAAHGHSVAAEPFLTEDEIAALRGKLSR